jgi:hypothetical protein
VRTVARNAVKQKSGGTRIDLMVAE